MKNLFISIFILCCCACFEHAYSQALYEVGIDEKIANSSHIIEGKVLEQKSFWNPAHTIIFTTNTIEVYKTFKGTVTSGTIEIMTTGGTVGLESMDASDLLILDKDNIGVFFCYPNSIKLLSPLTGNLLFDVYSSGQGSFIYDLDAKTANAPFVRYSSIENGLYKELINKTGHQPVIVNPSFNISAQAKPLSPLAPLISSFGPQLVNAGATLDPTHNLLTINGSGFGLPGDSSAVLFDDANDGTGGTPYKVPASSALVQSWTDNQIKIRVPDRAGTGYFSVRDNSSVIASSPAILSVNFSVLTRQITNGGVTVVKEINLMDDNGTGGYTVLYSTATGGGGLNLDAAPEKATFQRALTTWKELVGFNVIEGGTTVIQSVAADHTNVIMFDNSNTGNALLPAGVLAVCYSFSNMCTPVASNEIQKTEFDIVIRNTGVSVGSTSFTSGPCPPVIRFAQIDLETVLLHELGHALNLAHVNDGYEGSTLPNINPAKLMNYSVLYGVSRRSPDHSAYTGALYCTVAQGNNYGACSLADVEMTPLSRTTVTNDECPVNFPATSMLPNTTINFDLVHTTSNVFGDPSYTTVNCLGTGTAVTNNAYYAIRTNSDGGNLNVIVSGYATVPAAVQTSCTGIGIRFALYQVNSCPAGQAFPDPIVCRTFNANGALPVITGLAPNTTYLIYVDGISNTKANFTLTLNGTVLPLTLLDFKGNAISNKVNLYWKTTREVNEKEFLVEKSLDGVSFNQFAIISAKGTGSGNENNYNLTDDRPYSEYTFYRLKIMGKDGGFGYSGIVKVKTLKKAVVISRMFPNPASEKLNFQIISDESKMLMIETFDLLGKQVANYSISVNQGFNEKSVPVNTLASGTYFIQVKDAAGNMIDKSKFIKN